jgi:hypothetical protein
MTTLADSVCPMFGNQCRHLSIERTPRPYTEIERDELTGLYRPKRRGVNIAIIGEYCNDYGKYVRDMHYCPVKYSMTKATQQPLKELDDRKKRKEKARVEKLMVGCVGWR